MRRGTGMAKNGTKVVLSGDAARSMVPVPMTRIAAQDPRWLTLAMRRGAVADRLAVAVLGAVLAAGLGTMSIAAPVLAADPTPTIDPAAPTSPSDATPTPTPTPTASPSPSATPTPTPPPRPFTQSTWRSNAIVPQYTLTQCVGASIQTMRNEILRQIPVSRSKVYQHMLWTWARKYSKYTGDGGADPFGWAVSLRLSRAGNYKVVAEPTLAAALWVGAKAMRLTHRPVGALVWNGAHAWSIGGFETTADPATTDDFTVTAVYPSDPLYPKYSNRRWPVVRPHQRMVVSRLATYLTRYRDPRLDPLVQNLFVLVVPVGKDGIVPTPPAALLPPPPLAPPASPAPPPPPAPSGSVPTPTPSADAGATPMPAATPSPQPVTEPAATATPALPRRPP